MALTIKGIQLDTVRRPLKAPFKTALQTVKEREVLIVTVVDDSGLEGYGECVAFSTPWYTEETIASCDFVLKEVLIPLMLGKTIEHPEQIQQLFSTIKGNRMAKASIEMAVWDLYAKKKGQPLWQLLGGSGNPIPAGVVVAAVPGKIAEQVDRAVEAGYRRVKIKISPDSDVNVLKEVVRKHPGLLFFADANGTFTEESFEQLKDLDKAGFDLIEQPFGEKQWAFHARAKKEMKTPVCLDESITCIEDVQRMIEEDAGDIIVLKMGRLGGWSETLRVVELCRQHGIGMWVGGMIEFGVSKAHNLALASLPGITLPGDFSASTHFWEEDIIVPDIQVEDGEIKLSKANGIGYAVKR
ncbi:o-succinylbenzoate synthase [Planococcus salinus]|uniref:o-succinylbenzoate synthase n=1 Tax=Planococcus salinus TaxID=1848460 RepID=A0A3M8P3N5_9BACL|nr:o-succinylbenzoate synthase [Planococcus salinus]RNF38276.1 o-succinylbenzoate synthase [Planococcus salinus]